VDLERLPKPPKKLVTFLTIVLCFICFENYATSAST